MANSEELQERINKAIEVAFRYAGIDGSHHKMWVIDNMLQQLLGDSYDSWIAEYEGDPDDENNYYEWDRGTAP
jgi:hypothetical protein